MNEISMDSKQMSSIKDRLEARRRRLAEGRGIPEPITVHDGFFEGTATHRPVARKNKRQEQKEFAEQRRRREAAR